jgi:hypothetical protein
MALNQQLIDVWSKHTSRAVSVARAVIDKFKLQIMPPTGLRLYIEPRWTRNHLDYV